MRLVCFDLGGVLVEINHHWKGALLDAGFPLELAVKFDFPLVELEPFNDYQKGRLSLEAYLDVLSEFLAEPDRDRALAAHNAILRTTYPGVPKLIADVQAAGLATGVLSNTNAPHWEAMFHEPRLAVLKTISFPIASHLIGAEKPDPAMYRALENAAGMSGDQIVYFDDAFGNVEAAKELGWQAFRVDPEGDTAGQMRAKLVELEGLPPEANDQ